MHLSPEPQSPRAFCPVGLPGTPPPDYREQRFWYTLITLGQLQHRLVKPYERFPLKLASLVDATKSLDSRLNLARDFCGMSSCCLGPLFSNPVNQAARDEGGSHSLVTGQLSKELEIAFRSKTSNIEIELNFARASCSRQSMHGRAHNISSMAAKHVSAEIKLAQRLLD